MVRLFVYLLVNLIGIPCSYVVNQRRYLGGGEGGKELSRKKSWLFAIAIWIDVDVLLVLLITLRHRFLLASALWFSANILYILVFALRATRKSK
jgi:hypothetical protein